MSDRIDQLNQEFTDDLLGRGKGDPDIHGHYPGDPEEKDCELCNPKVLSESQSAITSDRINR